MTERFWKFFTIGIFVIVAFGIGALALFPVSWGSKKSTVIPQSRIIVPQSLPQYLWEDSLAEQQARTEQLTLKIPLQDAEILAALLNHDFDGDLLEEQIVAYRNLLENESPIYLSLIDYDESFREYRRVWTAPTAATRPGTLTLYTQDLIGDRGLCVLLSGMNDLGEHTLTVFRKMPQGESRSGVNPPFSKIAEIRIGGSIVVREVERVQAYQMGMARGQSFSITAYGRDTDSANIMDQVEITYTFNEAKGSYEQSRVTRIPGVQIEQTRVREILRSARAFEQFITGLWYHVSPHGTLDSRQYIYFDPPNREIIFYGDDTQQVFTWQNSNASRFGLYISGQNISVSTMWRSINIELESLDSIRVKVDEDISIKFGIAAPWDGSYRKAIYAENRGYPASSQKNAHISAIYNSTLGRLSFFPDGNFELSSGETRRHGKYAFFFLDDREFLELRSLENKSAEIQTATGGREIYLIESIGAEEAKQDTAGDKLFSSSPLRKIINLSRVRLGARGIQKLHEGIITLSLAGEGS